MQPLNEYIMGCGEDALSRREVSRIIDRYEWFTLARRARALVTGDPDPALVLPLMFWPTVRRVRLVSEITEAVETSEIAPQSDLVVQDELIDRFIARGGYRIVPSDEAVGVGVGVDAEIDIDPGMVSRELAEIYRSQGLMAEAEKIDRILKAR